ncbi:XRE family transcriptional regulator [Lacrimispora sp. AGF001]|uniref:XRE family transcriptional regulator n=1 Tax=Lacrimispora sp. AGF001 TaxID=3401631 RepID=UPI003B434786
MNIQKLKGKMAESGITQEVIADAIGMSRCTFYRKMKRRGDTFTVEEMNKIVKIIPLSREEAITIFFTL